MWHAPTHPPSSQRGRIWAHVWSRARAQAQAWPLRYGRPKKTPPGKTTYHICWNVSFYMFQLLFIELGKYGIPSRNDYHYKNRIEILYKKTCCAAPRLLSRAGFLGNYWNHRTLTRMSTRQYTVTALIASQINTVIYLSVTATHEF